MPFDFILRLYDRKKKYEPIMGGGVREFDKFERRQGVKSYLITGNSFPQNKGPGVVQIVDGFALTHDIPKDFWDEWLEQHEQLDVVVNGMVFAHEERASTLAEAKEKSGEKTNLERLDPNNLPKNIKTADSQHVAN